jgi:hypothetical protein
MGGRVAIGQRAIAGTRYDLFTAHQHATDRHLAVSAGATRLIECHIHKGCHCKFVTVTPRPARSGGQPAQWKLVPAIYVFIHVSHSMIRKKPALIISP